MRQDFSGITPARLAALFPVTLAPHNPQFAAVYQRERAFLQSVFGEKCLRISHVGSTAVPGIAAKPTTDILLEIARDTALAPITARMLDEGYVVNTPSIDLVMYLKGYTPQGFRGDVVHIHVRYLDDWGELYFRDYLCDNPDIAAAYETLKKELRDRFPHDRDGYTAAKGDFIRRHTEQARAAYPGRYTPLPGKTLSLSDADCNTLLRDI